jgi:tRNA/rRNA methyltransferase
MKPLIKPPVVVLVRPQIAENIGATARAMINFNAIDLRLVNPNPYDKLLAARMACDGREILEKVRVFQDLPEALADCTYSIATSRRLRRVKIPPLLPKEAIFKAQALPKKSKIALVFGAERAGLTNEEIFLCDTASTIPTTEKGSLNLGQSVVIFLYEWFAAAQNIRFEVDNPELDRLANHAEKQRTYDLVEQLLVASDYQPRGRLPEFVRRVKFLFEDRPMTLRHQRIFMRLLRYFEKLT